MILPFGTVSHLTIYIQYKKYYQTNLVIALKLLEKNQLKSQNLFNINHPMSNLILMDFNIQMNSYLN